MQPVDTTKDCRKEVSHETSTQQMLIHCAMLPVMLSKQGQKQKRRQGVSTHLTWRWQPVITFSAAYAEHTGSSYDEASCTSNAQRRRAIALLS